MNKHNVLAIDNSPVILRIVLNILEEAGCTVQTARDGLEALDVLKTFHPDLIFCDLVMPKIDGAKFSLILRNTPAYKNIFLVILSGIALENDNNVLELGADVCIAKGPAATMKKHILAAIHRFEQGRGGQREVEGLQGLYAREVTSELLVNKRHSEVIFERMTEGAFELDSQARVVRANPASCFLLNCSEAQILGTRCLDLLPEEIGDAFTDWLQRVDAEGNNTPLLFDYENPLQLQNRQVTLNLTPVFDRGQFFIVGILQDVTENKLLDAQKQQLEKDLQRIEKLDVMSTMASGIAHDFNNLLTIITGNIEMAKVLTTDNKVDQLLRETGKALRLTTGLIHQFSTFSDNYLPSKSRIYVDKLLAEFLENRLAGSSIQYQLLADQHLPCANLDANLMLQVFENIIANALEAMEGEGKLSISISVVEGRDEATRIGNLLSNRQFIRVRIHDTGTGIMEKDMDQIFDPYFSTKQRGTQKGMGLGLTIAHSIVKKHGGLIGLENSEKGGCTAMIYLPVALPVDATQEQTATAEPFRILILEDDEMMQKISTKMFEHFNCQVMLVENGEQAVQTVQQQMNEGNSFDLILLDLRIENGMNGVDAAKKIYAIQPQVTMVAMSGDDRDEIMRNYQNYHFAAAIAKPFSIDTVEALINTYSLQQTQ